MRVCASFAKRKRKAEIGLITIILPIPRYDMHIFKGNGLVRKFTKLIFSTIILAAGLMVATGTGQLAYAQSDTEQAPTQIPFSQIPFSEASIQAEMTNIQDDATISAEDKKPIIDLYTKVLARLSAGRASEEQAKVFLDRQEKAPEVVSALEEETSSVRKNLRRSREDVMADYDDKAVEELEQSLAKEQASADTLRGLMSQYDKYRQSLEQRPALALTEIARLEQDIADFTALSSEANGTSVAEIAEMGNLKRASSALTRAKFYADQQLKRELEQEMSSTFARSRVLDKQMNLTAAKIEQSNVLLSVLKERTGSARADDALLRYTDALRKQQEFLTEHPLLQSYVAGNVALAKRNLDIAKSEGNLPDEKIEISNKLSQVKFDANVTDQILGSQKVNRAYGAHLRSLRKKQPDISQIQQHIKVREIEMQDALFARITTQEDIGIFNAKPFDVNALKLAHDTIYGDSPPLSQSDIEYLQRAYDSRRGHLNELASVASLRARKLEEVNALHNKLLSDVKTLGALLDSRLLWLPSTETIGLAWPGKVGQGIVQTFSIANIGAVGTALVDGFGNSFFLVVLGLGFLAALHALRERLKPMMASMGARVGRVEKDGYRLTPLAMFYGASRAVIISGLVVILGMVFALSDVQSELVRVLPYICFSIAVPLFVFSCLRAWSFEGGLFDLHFHVDDQLRQRLRANIPWLIVVMTMSLVLTGMTRGSLDFDSGAAALGVFGFLMGALGISWFSLKMAWSRSKVFVTKTSEAEGMYLRNERWFMALGVIAPLGTAFLAAFGYFETAWLLLSRFFIAFCVLIAAYLIHGLLKRTLVIAQRRLALEQARVRRDHALKERTDKAAAEERGEIAVPKVDTESIDLETINRQSKQLISIAVFVGAVGIIWALWSDIFPALSVFDDVTIKKYNKMTADGLVENSITLWNVMQALGIGLITWLAARNLPGFLEMFVLKRTKMIQGSRYAIVTILGYMIFTIGILVAFDRLGTQWSQLQWVVAALGVGIGFGLQAIFANFISGIILLFERPVRLGDYITVGDISGTVTRIQIRATTLLDLDNKEILIPNQELVTLQVTNWTLDNPITRLIINVGIAYGSDTKLAHKTILAVVKQNKQVVKNPEPTVLFLGFGDSSLDFEIRGFLLFTQRFIVSHELHMAIDAALREANIEIAFPQRDLHIKNPEAIKMMIEPEIVERQSQPKPQPKRKPKRPAKVVKPKTS